MFSAALRVIGGNITQAKKVGKYSFCRFLAGRRTAGRRAREGHFSAIPKMVGRCQLFSLLQWSRSDRGGGEGGGAASWEAAVGGVRAGDVCGGVLHLGVLDGSRMASFVACPSR